MGVIRSATTSRVRSRITRRIPRLGSWFAAGCALALLGCALPSEEPDAAVESSALSAASLVPGAGAMKPRALAAKPTRAVKSPHFLDDEVIVKFKEGTRVRLRGGGLSFDPRALSGNEPALLARNALSHVAVTRDVQAANALLSSAAVDRYFDRAEADLERDKRLGEANVAEELADLNLYFQIKVDPRAQLALIDQLNALDSVEIAYASPIPQDAAVDLAPASPLFTGDQDYVNAAPIGIDARYARTVQGGAGLGVKVIDIESGWYVNHEDAPPIFATSGTVSAGAHGTAVMGVISAVENGYGMTGAASDAKFGIASVINPPPGGGPASYSVARAINTACASLTRGDIILIEQHYPGPDSGLGCACNCGQFEFVAMEYFTAEFDAIRAATSLGVNVVEAAGNGSMNLDSPIYGGAFNRAVRDSGAIVVGAGTSFGGRAPECWTNYGSRVDVHGWGDSVATLGYGDLAMVNGAGDANQFYTSTFGGTSSASPIVVSAVADLQGARIAHGLGIASTSAMRSLLVATGTPQTGANHIGPLPNLRAALDSLGIKPRTEFVWTAAAASLIGNSTLIDHPSLNNNPGAVLQVTHNWGSVVGGIYDDHLIGVWYTGTRWAIFHQDGTAIPANAMFNVVVNDGFVHRATAASISGHITAIDNPLANGNPNAVVIVTPNWNPGGIGGIYNNHPIGVWYNGSRWTIYNEDIAAMPVNAAFNVAISPHGSFVHVATSTLGNASYFTNPLASPLGARALITHNYGPFFKYNLKNTGVYYGAGTWAVYNEDSSAMAPNTTFNVLIANAPRATW
jgi:serine protease